MHLAAMCEELEVVQLLVASKADVRAKDTAGETPVEMAEGNDELLEALGVAPQESTEEEKPVDEI